MRQLKTCDGFALLESLIAMVLLTAGVLALLWSLQKGLAVQRQNVFRENAMRLADNMAQRMLMFTTPNYARDWGMPFATATPSCITFACNDAQWVAWQMQQANEELKQLHKGDMRITPLQTLPNGWEITVAWHDAAETFRTNSAVTGSACPADKSCWRLVFRAH